MPKSSMHQNIFLSITWTLVIVPLSKFYHEFWIIRQVASPLWDSDFLFIMLDHSNSFLPKSDIISVFAIGYQNGDWKISEATFIFKALKAEQRGSLCFHLPFPFLRSLWYETVWVSGSDEILSCLSPGFQENNLKTDTTGHCGICRRLIKHKLSH